MFLSEIQVNNNCKNTGCNKEKKSVCCNMVGLSRKYNIYIKKSIEIIIFFFFTLHYIVSYSGGWSKTEKENLFCEPFKKWYKKKKTFYQQ